MKKILSVVLSISLFLCIVPGLNLMASTPLDGRIGNVWGIGGITIGAATASGVPVSMTGSFGQRVNTTNAYSLDGLNFELSNLSVASNAGVGIAIGSGQGCFGGDAGVMFMFWNAASGNISSSQPAGFMLVKNATDNADVLPRLINDTKLNGSSFPTTLKMSFNFAGSNVVVSVNGQLFSIPKTSFPSLTTAYFSVGPFNNQPLSFTVKDISITTEPETVSAGGTFTTLDNSSLIPAMKPESQVVVDANGSPDWLDSLMMVNARLELLPETVNSGNLIDEAKALIDFYAGMGINGIWFNPVFERDPGAGSINNGYVMKDMTLIEQDIVGTTDKSLGRARFKEIVDYAHSKNVRIFLDMVVWGTATDAPTTITDKENFYKLDGSNNFTPYNGGYAFDWSKPALVTWYQNNAVSLVQDIGFDGYRCDLEPYSLYGGIASQPMWETIQSNAYTVASKRIAVISEAQNKNRTNFDFEQIAIGTGETMHGSQSYFLNNNIVDAVTTGVGVGDQSLATKGAYKYYANTITNHDTGASATTTRNYASLRNPLVLGYQAIFAPFIPIWQAGEEWDNAYSQVANGQGTLYFSKLDFTQASMTGNYEYLQTVIKMIRVKRLYPEIFSTFAADHRNSNILKVTSTNTTIQSYARFASGKAVIVVPNNNGEKISSTVTIPFSSMGLAATHYRVYDLMNDTLVATGTKTELAQITVDVLGNNMRVLLVEEDNSTLPGPQNTVGQPQKGIPYAPKGNFTSKSQIWDYWSQGINLVKNANGVNYSTSTVDGGGWGRRATTTRSYKLDGLNIKIKDLTIPSGMFTLGLYNIDSTTSPLNNWDGSPKTLLFIHNKNGANGTELLGRYGSAEANYFTGYRAISAPVTTDLNLSFKKLSATTWAYTVNGETILLTQEQLTRYSGGVQRGLTDLDNVFVNFGLWADVGSFTVSQIYNGEENERLGTANVGNKTANVYGSTPTKGTVRDTWGYIASQGASLGAYDAVNGRKLSITNMIRVGSQYSYALDNLTVVLKNSNIPAGCSMSMMLSSAEDSWYDSAGIMFINQAPNSNQGQVIAQQTTGSNMYIAYAQFNNNPFSSETVIQFVAESATVWGYYVNGQRMGEITQANLTANGLNKDSVYLSFGNWWTSAAMSYNIAYIGYDYISDKPSAPQKDAYSTTPYFGEVGAVQAEVMWNAAQNNYLGNLGGYVVERYNGSTLENSITTKFTGITDTGLTLGSTYTYKIKAVTDTANPTTVIGTYLVNSATTTLPVVTGVAEAATYNIRSGARVITFDRGTATLNGNAFTSGSSISTTGDYSIVVTDKFGNNKTVNFTYLKYGDVTGEGDVDITDLGKIKLHLLNTTALTGAFLGAGDVYGKGNVSISDLLAVKKHIMGLINIDQ